MSIRGKFQVLSFILVAAFVIAADVVHAQPGGAPGGARGFFGRGLNPSELFGQQPLGE